MRDVYDGELYKRIQQIFSGVLTYNFGTNGAPTNPNSSIKSFWPCEMATKWLRKCSLNESISRFSMSKTCTSYCENLIARKNLTPEKTRRAENNTVVMIGKSKMIAEVTRIMRLTLCDETVTPLVYDRCI